MLQQPNTLYARLLAESLARGISICEIVNLQDDCCPKDCWWPFKGIGLMDARHDLFECLRRPRISGRPAT